MADYAHPEVLVTTDWVAQHGSDAGIRLVEVDVDTAAYDEGHISGAVGLNWQTQLCDQVRRDILTKEQFEGLCQDNGISNDTTVIFYGDNNNWFATYALWQFRYYGHDESKLKVMDGGRQKWIDEGRDLVTDTSSPAATDYKAKFPDDNVRATKDHVLPTLEQGIVNLVDVRSPAEFSGEIIAPPRVARNGTTSGTYSGCSEYPLGNRSSGRRHLQILRRVEGDLRGRGGRSRQGDGRLLPNWRAFLAHMVRAQVPLGLRKGPQLRRQLDRVGQSCRRTHRQRIIDSDIGLVGARICVSTTPIHK